MICKTCLYRVKSTRNFICEKTGKHLYWNQQSCPDYSATVTKQNEDKTK